MTAPAIRIDGIDKRFGNVRALEQVSFEVPARCAFGLLGPNGAGKTTLFSIIANFLSADAGTVEVLGTDVRRIAALRGRMTILPQDAQFQRNIPILEQLVLFRMLDGKDRRTAEQQVQESLALVGLAEHARRGVRTLSHGMVKRLGIAQAFLGEPEVILLDEPTAGLDPANARQIRDLVVRLRERATVVISSHNLAEIQDMCSHVAIMSQGKLVASGAVADMTRAGRELDTRLSRDLGEDELARLRALPVVAEVVASGPLEYTFRLALGDGDWDAAVAAVLRALLDQGVVPRRLGEGKSLESHFLRLTERGDVEGASET